MASLPSGCSFSTVVPLSSNRAAVSCARSRDISVTEPKCCMRIQKRPHLILQENILHAKQYRVILREKEMEKKEDRSFFWRFHSAFPSSSNRFDVAVVMTAGLERNGTFHGQHQHHAFRVSSARFDVASLVCRSYQHKSRKKRWMRTRPSSQP